MKRGERWRARGGPKEKHMASPHIRRFWFRVAALGCVVCGNPAEIAHVVGKPSVTERIREPKPKGKKLQRHDFLVLPACPFHHRLAPDSLDLNPREFERRYGPVAGHLDAIAAVLDVDVWAHSQRGRKC